MKFCLTFLIALLLAHSARTQAFNDYDWVDYKIAGIPADQTNTAASIAAFIVNNFKTETEQFRAIHSWVSTNIRYDTDSMYAINWSSGGADKVTGTLRRRKGVCENYAALFTEIARQARLKAVVVDGFSKQFSSVDKTGHSWCAARVDDEWKFCDPTWDKDARSQPRYFLIEPEQFIESHFPFDPIWQLLDRPRSFTEFKNGNVGERQEKVFNVKDSVNAFLQYTRLQQLETALTRMNRAAYPGELPKNRIAYTRMQIAIIYEQKDMELYNAAVVDLNLASKLFNEYLQYRNNQFIPARDTQQPAQALEKVGSLIQSAHKKISGISPLNDQYDPSELLQRLNNLQKRMNEQQAELNNHFDQNHPHKKPGAE